jgi:hypothetical protein
LFISELPQEIKLSRVRGLETHSVTGLTPPHFYVCSKPGPGYPTPYVMFFFVFCYLRRQVVVGFVNIGGIVDPHCVYSFISYPPLIRS